MLFIKFAIAFEIHSTVNCQFFFLFSFAMRNQLREFSIDLFDDCQKLILKQHNEEGQRTLCMYVCECEVQLFLSISLETLQIVDDFFGHLETQRTKHTVCFDEKRFLSIAAAAVGGGVA